MNIKPLYNRILVKPFEPEEKSVGGIIVPDSVKERPNKATVIEVGEGLKERPMKINKGDIVFHIKGAGTLIDENENYYIMNDLDVLALMPN